MNLARFISTRQGVMEERQRRYNTLEKMILEGIADLEKKKEWILLRDS